jgi:hypothetical protein
MREAGFDYAKFVYTFIASINQYSSLQYLLNQCPSLKSSTLQGKITEKKNEALGTCLFILFYFDNRDIRISFCTPQLITRFAEHPVSSINR